MEDKAGFSFIELISQFNLLGKLLAIFFNHSKLDAVHSLVKGPIFAVETERDQVYFNKYKLKAVRIFTFINYFMGLVSVFWIADRLMKKINNPEYSLSLYYPFEIISWNGFLGALIFEAIALIWSAFGHYALDCMIISYYLQASYQLKSLKYKLRHIFDDIDVIVTNDTRFINSSNRFKFLDEFDVNLNNRFIRKYENISCFVNEINIALSLGITINFMTLSLGICSVIFIMTSSEVFSMQSIFLLTVVVLYQAQSFLYCYHGQLVQNESDTVNTAIYFSNWFVVSPKFRRQILIAMCRWHYGVVPKVSSIIPIGFSTFVWITRSAYTIYNVMKNNERN